MQRLGAAEHARERLDRRAHDVVQRLLRGQADTPAVCVWKRICHDCGFFAPKVSRSSRAQMRRAARYLAISSKKSIWALKKNDSRGANSSTSRPRSTACST